MSKNTSDDTILLDNVKEFNKDHASVLLNSKHRILRKELDQSNNETYSFIRQNDFFNVHQNNFIQLGKDKTVSAAKAWLRHDKCETYHGGVFFKPVPYGAANPFASDAPNKRRYNLWKSFAIQPLEAEEDAETHLIYDHICDVICGGGDEIAEYVFKWIAYTFQNPGKPAGVALVIRGEKGTGKGILGNFLQKIWGSHGVQIGHQNLTKKFNAQLLQTCFVFADEVFVSGQKSDEATLKMLITEPTITIEPKGIDSYSQPNYLKIMMATNEDYAVPASKDERRFCVCDVSNVKRGDTAYFKALVKACNSPEVQADFLHFMLNLDISDFEITVVPETAALQSQRQQSLNSVGQWLSDGLSVGSFIYEGTWEPVLSTETLYDSYVKWLNIHHIPEPKRASLAKMSEYLGKIGYKKKRCKDLEGIERRGYILGSLDNAIELFETYEKVAVA